MSVKRKGGPDLDFVAILCYILFLIVGIGAIYTSQYTTNAAFWDTSSLHFKQMIIAGIAIFIAAVILVIDGSFFTQTAYLVYGLSILTLIAVLIFGREVSGGKSWFDLGIVRFQPSEFAKFSTCLALSKFLVRDKVNLKNWKHLFTALLIIFLPAVLIILQGDTGSALVFAALLLVLYRAGMHSFIIFFGFFSLVIGLITLLVSQTTFFIGLLVLLVLVGVLFVRNNTKLIVPVIAFAAIISVYSLGVNYAFEKVLKPHQQNRINVMLGKIDDVKGIGYNVYQAKIAMGSGGVTGRGYLKGMQTKFNFVPELSTDFIFCTIGEEFGFIGVAFVLLMYLGLLVYIINISERQRSKFTSIYAYGVLSILFFHIAVNVGMTIGLVPVIGIPLPFISYGGSALLGFTILLFILIKLDSERNLVLR